MKISEKTKISQLIKQNSQSTEVIAGINKHFNKLRNPVLRKLLAPRVSIAEAAKIGGSTVEVFLAKLKEIGFEIDNTKYTKMEEQAETNASKMGNIDINKLVTIDVRPTIEAGNDPFKTLMDATKKLPDDGVLLVINSFEPLPLINNLRDKGFGHQTERHQAGVVHTYFFKSKNAGKLELQQMEQPDVDDFELTVSEFGENMKIIDVRDLEMPEPMVTILKEIENLPEGHALYVHHKRVPQFLLPELKNRNFNILSQEEDENNVKLLIYKN
jgi:uncharacterized protein (DUF2249 family)